MLGIPCGEVAEIALAEQYAFRLSRGARRVQRHAGRILIGSNAYMGWSSISHRNRSDIQRRKLRSRQRVRAIVQQQHRSRVFQNVLLTLHGLAGIKWQVNRTATQNRENARIQLG